MFVRTLALSALLLASCGAQETVTVTATPEVLQMSPDCVEGMENYMDVIRVLVSIIEDNTFSANPISLAEVNERLAEVSDMMDATLPTAEACRESVES